MGDFRRTKDDVIDKQGYRVIAIGVSALAVGMVGMVGVR